jgi:nucleotide-binding universal stress UspA family protein
MSEFSSLLVPLDGSVVAARSLDCAVWLAQRLKARLHLLTATSGERPARDELRRLRVSEHHWPLIELHQMSAPAEKAIIEAAVRHDARLVVMSARGESSERTERGDSAQPLGHVARFVIERSAAPVLLMPQQYRQVLPWERLVVPVSGALACDDAVAVAVRLACALDLTVKVVHVANPSSRDEGLEARARYSDALHHEYSGQLDELVRRAIALLGAKERRRIESVALSSGDVLARLVEVVGREHGSVIVVGWRGTFAPGHAEVLKALIREITSPLLLVRRSGRQTSQLNVGEEFDRS